MLACATNPTIIPLISLQISERGARFISLNHLRWIYPSFQEEAPASLMARRIMSSVSTIYVQHVDLTVVMVIAEAILGICLLTTWAVQRAVWILNACAHVKRLLVLFWRISREMLNGARSGHRARGISPRVPPPLLVRAQRGSRSGARSPSPCTRAIRAL